MAITHEKTDLHLSRQQIADLLDKEARARLDISAQELLRAYVAGTLEDPGAVGDLLVLADLLAEDDPLVA